MQKETDNPPQTAQQVQIVLEDGRTLAYWGEAQITDDESIKVLDIRFTEPISLSEDTKVEKVTDDSEEE